MTFAEDQMGLFRQGWWLDATAGSGQWGEAVVASGGSTVACLRYAVTRPWGRTFLTMPPLTQTLGPWIAPHRAKEATNLGREKALVGELFRQLPKHDYFVSNLGPDNTNWLPWYWLGCSQTTRYTYALDLTAGEAELWKGVLPKVRTDVRKAATRFGLTIRSDLDLDAFLKVHELTFTRQGLKLPIDAATIRRVDAACADRGCRKIFFAVDRQGAVHAAVYLVWDSARAYYLMGGGDPALRTSGATSLALWESIRFAATVAPTFDFEGSMMEPVERFVRGFGASQVPYHRVWRAANRWIGAALGLRAAARALCQRP